MDDNVQPVQGSTVYKTSAILNLLADTLHNFTDGLAIAVAFSENFTIGVGISVAVLIHELPHEIGDFAILVQSGLTPWKAIKLQLVTAVGALLGCCLGITGSGTPHLMHHFRPIF